MPSRRVAMRPWCGNASLGVVERWEHLLDRRPERARHASADAILAARRLLWTAATLAGRIGPGARPELPDGLPSIRQSVESFVPTAWRLAAVPRESRRPISTDVDHSFRPRFVTTLGVRTDRRRAGSGSEVRRPVEALLAPPALPSEAAERARLLAATRIGVPLSAGRGGGLPGLPDGALTRRERRRSEFVSLDERVVLGAVLAGRGGVAVALSPRGDWPAGALVEEVAARVACRIVRARLDVLPADVLPRLEWIGYDEVAPADYGPGGGAAP